MIFLHTYQTGEEPHTADLFQTFRKDRFLRVVGGMAWMSLWIFLWSLIPVVGIVFGVIRMYEYRFVPYILMTRDDVKPPTRSASPGSRRWAIRARCSGPT